MEKTEKSMRLMTNAPALVSLRDILVDEKFNCRVHYYGVTEDYVDPVTGEKQRSLASQIKESNFIQPATVKPTGASKGPKYFLVSGFRRFKAVEHLWREEKDAEEKDRWLNGFPIVLTEASDEQAYFLNLTENIQRAGLSSYEIGLRCQMLANKFKLKQTDIAARLGHSQGYVSTLIQAVEKLAPEILNAWKNGHRAVTLKFLRSLFDKSPEEQLDLLHAAIGERGTEGETGAGKSGGTEDKSRTRPRKQLEKCFERFTMLAGGKERVKGIEQKSARLVAMVMEWAIGIREEYPGMPEEESD